MYNDGVKLIIRNLKCTIIITETIRHIECRYNAVLILTTELVKAYNMSKK